MRTAYMSIAAAEGNIGDVHIRREAIALVAPGVDRGVVFTGKMGSSYISAFELPSRWSTTSSPLRFLWRLTLDGLRRQAVIIMAPGPASLSGGLISSAKRLLVAGYFATLVLFGSRLLVLGRALRGQGKPALYAEKLMASKAALYTTRDKISSEIVQCGSFPIPDLAFADYTPESTRERDLVALSFRHDRRISEVAVERLVAQIKAAGLDAIFVTQVREDNQRNDDLALRFGVSHLAWEAETTHSEQEVLIRQLYATCSGVVSDRLHVLILGARQNAIPVIVDSPTESKLHATLDSYLMPQSVYLGDATGEINLDLGDKERRRIDKGMRCAAEELSMFRNRVEEVL